MSMRTVMPSRWHCAMAPGTRNTERTTEGCREGSRCAGPTGEHAHGDAGALALRDGGGHLAAQRVLDAHQRGQHQLALQARHVRLLPGAAGALLRQLRRGHLPIRQRQHPAQQCQQIFLLVASWQQQGLRQERSNPGIGHVHLLPGARFGRSMGGTSESASASNLQVDQQLAKLIECLEKKSDIELYLAALGPASAACHQVSCRKRAIETAVSPCSRSSSPSHSLYLASMPPRDGQLRKWAHLLPSAEKLSSSSCFSSMGSSAV